MESPHISLSLKVSAASPLVSHLPGEYKYFRYYIKENCGHFTINGRHDDNSLEGDIDIYVSTTNRFPQHLGDNEWEGHISGDDSITAINVCRDNAPLVFYIGVKSFAGTNELFTLTATSNLDLIEFYPLNELPPGQVRNCQSTILTFQMTASLANSIDLWCGGQRLSHEYSTYPECVQDGFNVHCSFVAANNSKSVLSPCALSLLKPPSQMYCIPLRLSNTNLSTSSPWILLTMKTGSTPKTSSQTNCHTQFC